MRSGIIGDDAFIKSVRDEEEEPGEKNDDLIITIADLIGHVCARYGVTEMEISSGSRVRELAHIRAVIALLARDVGLSIIDVAKKLNRDPGGLSRLANKLDRDLNESDILKEKITSLMNELLRG
jgi:chromosomal replication initiation ATPase DnaA